MALPITKVTTHEADAKARLPGWLVDSTNYRAFLDILVTPYQDAEDLLIALLDGHSIETAVGVQLDVIGEILDLSRTSAGETDTAYRTRLFGRAAELSASGEPETLIATWLRIWTAIRVIFEEFEPATFGVTAEVTTDPNDPDQDQAALTAIRSAKAGGVGVIPAVVETPEFLWGDSADADGNGDLPDSIHGWGDTGSKSDGIFAKFGTDFPLVMSLPAFRRMTATDVAHISNTGDSLGMYRFDKGPLTWSLVGSVRSFPGSSGHALASLNATDVVIYTVGGRELELWRFNGSTWSQVGSSFSSGIVTAQISVLPGTNDIVMAGVGSDDLEVFRWNGSTFSSVGNPFSPGNIVNPSIAGLTATTFAFADSNLGLLELYNWDGTNITKVGNSLAVTGSPELGRMNNIRVAFIDGDFDIRVMEFDGTDWSQIGSDLNIGSFTGKIETLDENEIVLAHDLDNELQYYRSGVTPDVVDDGGKFSRIIT